MSYMTMIHTNIISVSGLFFVKKKDLIMNISKENLFLLLDEFGKNLLFEPEAGYTFSLDVTRKLDDIDYIKNNLDKPFTAYTDENGKLTVETLYDFIKTRYVE